MWPRWNTRPIAVQGFPALPTDVDPGHHVASTAPFIRAGDAVSAPARGGSAVSDWTAAELLWGQLHSVPAGIVCPRGRPPPAHQAPPRPPSCGTPSNGSNPAELVPLVGWTYPSGPTHAAVAAATSPLTAPGGRFWGDSGRRQLQLGHADQVVGGRREVATSRFPALRCGATRDHPQPFPLAEDLLHQRALHAWRARIPDGVCSTGRRSCASHPRLRRPRRPQRTASTHGTPACWGCGLW
jgi:hypothetical protein